MDYPSLDAALEKFLSEYIGKPEYPKYVCIGIAGPVDGDKVKITNAHWPEVSIAATKVKLHFNEFFMLNDFEANGYGVLAMPSTMYTPVTTNVQIEGKPKILLGTGTGLGECIVTKSPDSPNYVVFPCEGGHVDFAAKDEIEFGFMQYVK